MNNLFKNLSLRIIALLCAVALWFYATLNRKVETVITIPIRLVNVQENLTPANAFPEKAKVLVSGTGRQLFMLKFYDAELLINGEKAAPGINTFRITGDNVEIRGNPGVRVLLVKEPVQLSIHFDAIVEKEVPLIPDINIVTAQDRVLTAEPSLIPNRIVIRGPRCHVSRIDSLQTRHVEVNRLGSDTGFFAFVRNPGYFGVDLQPNKVRVRLTAQRVEKRRIDSIPVRLMDAPPGSRLNTRWVSLTIAGAGKDVKEIRRENINVLVNFRRFALEGQNEVEPTIGIIGNVQWSNLEPQRVRLITP